MRMFSFVDFFTLARGGIDDQSLILKLLLRGLERNVMEVVRVWSSRSTLYQFVHAYKDLCVRYNWHLKIQFLNKGKPLLETFVPFKTKSELLYNVFGPLYFKHFFRDIIVHFKSKI